MHLVWFNNSKNPVKHQRFLKDFFVIRRIVKIFHHDVPDKMAVISKLSSQYYPVVFTKHFNFPLQTITTFLFFHLCIILSLFAMVLEGVDWVTWKNMDSLRRHYEDKDGFSCNSINYTCACTKSSANINKSKATSISIFIHPYTFI